MAVAESIAQLYGCTLDLAAVHPCMVGGKDIGQDAAHARHDGLVPVRDHAGCGGRHRRVDHRRGHRLAEADEPLAGRGIGGRVAQRVAPKTRKNAAVPRPQAPLTVAAMAMRGQNSGKGRPLISGTTYMATSDGASAPKTMAVSQ